MIRINRRLSIPEDELVFVASHSGGPGGQNVNKVSTRVTLCFDVARSPSLTEEERARLVSVLRSRITRDGVLRVASQRERSQYANRKDALGRLVELLREALREVPVRKRTRPPRGATERRLADKKHRSRVKRQRSCREAAED